MKVCGNFFDRLAVLRLTGHFFLRDDLRKDAIRKATEPLEKDKFVTAAYKEAIIANVEELGPYICIAPHVAMPHARPEQGALSTQIAVTLD